MLKKISLLIICDFALRRQRAMAITGIDLFNARIIQLNETKIKKLLPTIGR
jgi:hypothetical protein